MTDNFYMWECTYVELLVTWGIQLSAREAPGCIPSNLQKNGKSASIRDWSLCRESMRSCHYVEDCLQLRSIAYVK